MSIKISVVIPTYRRPELLIKCLNNLTKQNFNLEELEVIVVSDGPDQTTEHSLQEWLKLNILNLNYYNLPEKKGPAAARNKGWQLAKAPLIAFTDDDCLPDSNWLRSFFKSWHPGSIIAFTGQTIVPLEGKPTDYERNVANLQNANFITANCCCTKSALEKTGGFDEEFTMAWREDSDLEFQLFRQHIPVLKIEDALIVHPVRKARWGVSIFEQKKTMFNVLLFKKFPALYRKKIQPQPPVKYYFTIAAFTTMLTGLIAGNAWLTVAGGIIWFILAFTFIIRRLRDTALSLNHVLEMTVTSLLIPFLSIYWQFYGVIKYKKLLI